MEWSEWKMSVLKCAAGNSRVAFEDSLCSSVSVSCRCSEGPSQQIPVLPVRIAVSELWRGGKVLWVEMLEKHNLKTRVLQFFGYKKWFHLLLRCPLPDRLWGVLVWVCSRRTQRRCKHYSDQWVQRINTAAAYFHSLVALSRLFSQGSLLSWRVQLFL